MRLDLFLKDSRIIKRRTIAKEFCDRGLVKVNEKLAKPSFELKGNELVTIKFGEKQYSIIVKIEIVGKKERGSYVQVESR